MYKSKDEVIAELQPLLAEPLAQLIALHDSKAGRDAYETFMGALAGYYVRGTADFYNAGVQAERRRKKL